jgi:hypothetical protein
MKILFLDESGDHNLSVIDPQARKIWRLKVPELS